MDLQPRSNDIASIKFCGLTRAEDARVAALLGASHIGAIFVDNSRRRVTPDTARLVFDAAGPDVMRVGVFSCSRLSEIGTIARHTELDVVQLHAVQSAMEIQALRNEFSGPVWAVLGVDADRPRLPAGAAEIAEAADAVVFDTSAGGSTGGTGRTFGWAELAADAHAIAGHRTIVLAGGLNPANVNEAVRIFSPAMVDVSSGVEQSPGIKDHDLMSAFANAVRSS